MSEHIYSVFKIVKSKEELRWSSTIEVNGMAELEIRFPYQVLQWLSTSCPFPILRQVLVPYIPHPLSVYDRTGLSNILTLKGPQNICLTTRGGVLTRASLVLGLVLLG